MNFNNRSKRRGLLFLFLLLLLGCKDFEKFQERDLPTAAVVEYNFNFYPAFGSNQVVQHNNFTLSYDERYEQAEWVAYELKKENLSQRTYSRPFFIQDPKVITYSADWRNYRNSGYDRGHLCPAGDMKQSKQAYEETFYTSNVSPQLPEFNNGIWNRLEQKVRYWAQKYDGLYVVTGGVLAPDLKTIGKEKVAVPDYFYKILLDTSRGEYKMIGFLVPHKKSNQPLYDFVVPVKKIEELTGIDFFPHLPDDFEEKLESGSDYKGWSFK